MKIAIVGAGSAGLFAAWYLQRLGEGLDITVYDRLAPGQGTTRRAAGMLAPVHELEFQELALLHAGLASRKLYQEEVAPALGDIGLRPGGSLEIALTQDDAAYLQRQYEFQRSHGLEVEWVTGPQIQDIEPFISPHVKQGIYSRKDTQIDHWLLVERLVEQLRAAGVEFRDGMELRSWTHRAEGVTLHFEGEDVECDRVLLALGVPGDEMALQLPYKIYPVRGEMIALRMAEGEGPRMQVRIQSKVLGSAYVVPKAGRLLCGSTSEEQGLNQSNTAGGMLNILRKCHAAVPSIFELELEEVWAGLRPSTLNRLPVLGQSIGTQVFHLNGLYRHGILLGPLMGKSAARLLLGQERLPETATFTLPTETAVRP